MSKKIITSRGRGLRKSNDKFQNSLIMFVWTIGLEIRFFRAIFFLIRKCLLIYQSSNLKEN